MENKETTEDGYEIPIHRSLMEPVLIAGVPREVAIINLTLAGIFVVALHLIYTSLFFLILHVILAHLTKKDDQFFEALLRHFDRKGYYEA